MIQIVESKKAVYGYEYHQITSAIIKFRDWFTENKTEYGIPQSKLDELNGYISEFPTIKFGDGVMASWTNSMVEALRVIGDLVQYVSILFYRRAWYISPLLERYYTSYLSGHWNEFWNYPAVALFSSVAWRFNTTGGTPSGAHMGSFEHWFKVNRHYDTAIVKLRATMTTGKNGEPSITIYFLSSGIPKPLSPINQRESIITRTNVTKKATCNINYVSGQSNYNVTQWIEVNSDITYVVVVERDDYSNVSYYTDISELSIT